MKVKKLQQFLLSAILHIHVKIKLFSWDTFALNLYHLTLSMSKLHVYSQNNFFKANLFRKFIVVSHFLQLQCNNLNKLLKVPANYNYKDFR
jgi:hypothetical protein